MAIEGQESRSTPTAFTFFEAMANSEISASKSDREPVMEVALMNSARHILRKFGYGRIYPRPTGISGSSKGNETPEIDTGLGFSLSLKEDYQSLPQTRSAIYPVEYIDELEKRSAIIVGSHQPRYAEFKGYEILTKIPHPQAPEVTITKRAFYIDSSGGSVTDWTGKEAGQPQRCVARLLLVLLEKHLAEK